MSRSVRRATTLATALTALALAACGSGEDAENQTDASQISERSTETRGDADGALPVPPVSGPSADETRKLLQGRKRVRTPGGGVAYLPVKPRRTSAPPSRSCAVIRDDPGRSLRPPSPGLSARRLDAARIEVRVVLASVDDRCRPDYVRLTIDVNDDPLPPSSTTVKVTKLERPLVIPVPERIRNADVIRASSQMSSTGASSDTVSVLITGERAG